jgi:murein DD-endopeptidase MepM/ murein hydrolase activator NlpD
LIVDASLAPALFVELGQLAQDLVGDGWIVIRHDVNGLQFDSVYAHMQRDSVTLNVGDTALVSEYIGRVGTTGTSTGAHLHLEIHVGGVQVDPFEWLKANTAQ